MNSEADLEDSREETFNKGIRGSLTSVGFKGSITLKSANWVGR